MNGIVLFLSREADQLLAVIIISAVFLCIVIVAWPFKMDSDNKVQSAFLAQVLWTTLAAIALKLRSGDSTSVTPLDNDIGWSIIGGSILIGCLLLYWVAVELRAGLKESHARVQADAELSSTLGEAAKCQAGDGHGAAEGNTSGGTAGHGGLPLLLHHEGVTVASEAAAAGTTAGRGAGGSPHGSRHGSPHSGHGGEARAARAGSGGSGGGGAHDATVGTASVAIEMVEVQHAAAAADHHDHGAAHVGGAAAAAHDSSVETAAVVAAGSPIGHRDGEGGHGHAAAAVSDGPGGGVASAAGAAASDDAAAAAPGAATTVRDVTAAAGTGDAHVAPPGAPEDAVVV